MFGLISLNGTADAPMLSNFTDHGGLFPNGFLAVFIAMISVSFAFSGTELIGVTAGESANPQKDIPRSIRSRMENRDFFHWRCLHIIRVDFLEGRRRD